MDLKLINPPTDEPIDLQEAKQFLRVDCEQGEDLLIESFIAAARKHAEEFQRRALATQTWEMILDQFPRDRTIRIPLPPLQEVESVKYRDEIGDEHEFESYVVNTDAEPGVIALEKGENWPRERLFPTGAVRIRFVAGYNTENPIPETTKQALQLLTAHFYENRETVIIGTSVVQIPFTVETLLWPNRTW